MDNNKPWNLSQIYFCRNEDASQEEFEFLEKKINFKVTTWLRLYEHADTIEHRAKLRDVVIGIAHLLYHQNISISISGSFIHKLNENKPYNFFLTAVDCNSTTEGQFYSATFHEIIDHSLGTIVDSLHIGWKFSMLWTTLQYMLACQYPKMTVICNYCIDFEHQYTIPFDIDIHTYEDKSKRKLTIFKYIDNTIRIVILTSDLNRNDWFRRTGGFWISPKLPLLPEDAEDTEGESPTNFKQNLIDYFSTLEYPELMGWKALLYRTDFSSVNVFLITSIPGMYKDSQPNLETLLLEHSSDREHSSLPTSEQVWPIIAQFSCLEVNCKNDEKILNTNVIRATNNEKVKNIMFKPTFKMIFPTQNNFSESYEKLVERNCEKLRLEKDAKQQWTTDSVMYQWRSDHNCRTEALPTFETCTKISPDETEIAWFFFTDDALSKSFWGTLFETEEFLHSGVQNLDFGILFIPQFMVNQKTFPIKLNYDVRKFRLPYDIPLTEYSPDDKPVQNISE